MRTLMTLVLAATDLSACVAIEGERIRAGEIAATVSVFRALESETDLGPAPVPSVRRILTKAQLLRLALANGVSGDGLPESLCLERRQESLSPTALETALSASAAKIFPGAALRIELVDFSRQPVPNGTIQFQRPGVLGGVNKLPDSPVLWRGTLTTGERRTLPIWAKVRILTERACWMSSQDLSAGTALASGSLRREVRWLNPFLFAAECADLSVGSFMARRRLRAGQVITKFDLAALPTVRRGESVQASLSMSNATLRFPAIAETDGVAGSPVLIKHEGKRLRARVTGTAAVQIEPGGAH
jgi:flagella basal body P-ring formation protein FlgA